MPISVQILSQRRHRGLTAADLENREAISQIVRDNILSDLPLDTEVSFSKGRLNKLLKSLRARGLQEANAIFPRAIAIINRARTINLRTLGNYEYLEPREVFNDRDLASSRRRSTTRSLVPPRPGLQMSGSVLWKDLSPSWVVHKYGTNPANYNKFFQNTGRLKSQLGATSALVGKLGGVEAKARVAGDRRIDKRTLRWVLAELDIVIFPGIKPNLLPMLASQRWTSSSGGALERWLIPGKGGEKLAGPQGFHRPLLTPLIQFWLAFRIPRALELAIDDWLKSPRGGAVP